MKRYFKRFTTVFLFTVSIISCGDNTELKVNRKAENPDSTEEEKVEVDSALQARVNAMLGIGYPTLEDNNAEEFLRNWGKDNPISNVILKTKHGEIEIELFHDTPIHSWNFLYKIHRQYFTDTEFTRVVPEFVIQGGNSEEERPQEQRFSIGNHTLMPEFKAHHIHKRGALAMSRSYSNNPDKKSSAYDFYIVTGRKIGNVELSQIEKKNGITYTAKQKLEYRNIGGAPHLDGEHTVFGRVVRGMDVADKIAQTPTDASDWPLERLEIEMVRK